MTRAPASAEELMRSRIDGCRKGGLQSGKTRQQTAKRPLVERAIAHHANAGGYTRDTAARIARYLGVSTRYVRMVAAAAEKKRK